MLDAMGQTGMGKSRLSKAEDKGYFYLWNDMPLLMGSGIQLEYIDLVNGVSINPNLVPWTQDTRVGLRISLA